MSTRTEQGYALWKDDPKSVAAARVQAKGIIGQRMIRAEIDKLVIPVVDWLARVLDRKGKR
jgi:hypothetical protein